MKQELEQVDAAHDLGTQMHDCIRELFPLHRAITGTGVRESLRYLQQFLPLKIHEVPTGTPVFDWTIPQEWEVSEAFIADVDGNRIVDYADHNLQLMSNSQPVNGRFKFSDLKQHLFTLSEEMDPSWIPYRTAFFREDWGFCLNRGQFDRLSKHDSEEFDVVIDSKFFDGSLTYGEATIEGKTDDEILVYAHCCHPSLANDNLSGMAVAAFFARQLLARIERGDVPRKTYKFIFAPATIGAITWLARNQASLHKIRGGLILSLLGDSGGFTYKRSRLKNSTINRAVELSFDELQTNGQVRQFTPFGYDERQFCSPGINLPVGCLMRTANGEFPEYHTSGDNLEFVTPAALLESLHLVVKILTAVEQNEIPVSNQPCCEPQLGERGLYRAFGQHDDRGRFQEAVLWVLNLADGEHDLLDIAKQSKLPFGLVLEAANVLCEHELVHFSND